MDYYKIDVSCSDEIKLNYISSYIAIQVAMYVKTYKIQEVA